MDAIVIVAKYIIVCWNQQGNTQIRNTSMQLDGKSVLDDHMRKALIISVQLVSPTTYRHIAILTKIAPLLSFTSVNISTQTVNMLIRFPP